MKGIKGIKGGKRQSDATNESRTDIFMKGNCLLLTPYSNCRGLARGGGALYRKGAQGNLSLELTVFNCLIKMKD